MLSSQRSRLDTRGRWLSFCLLALAVACGSSVKRVDPVAETRQEPRVAAPPEPQARAELRVGTSFDYAPFSTRDAAGAPQGFDVELAEQLASDLGLELVWVPFRWTSLQSQLTSDALDVAMGGVTWQPARAVLGHMTRSVARGGPCVLGDPAAARVAVNRGGVLELWARGHWPDRELITVTDNTSLPSLLESRSVGAIVTDSFERKAFQRPGWAVTCEPPLARKVYWVAPARAGDLGPRIDAWLLVNIPRVLAAQARWFGEQQRLDATTHLVDLLARRFAFMPIVAALKAEQGLPIEDLAREAEVLLAVGQSARRLGLPEQPVGELFALTISLSKAVQRRQREASRLDLAAQVRPAVLALGERILQALVEARSEGQLGRLTLVDLELLSPWLSPPEREQLLTSLRALGS